MAMALFLSMVFFVQSASAQAGAGRGNNANVSPIQEGINEFEDNTALGTQSPIVTIAEVINVIIGFLAIISVVIMLWGGFRWMTAGGNDDAVAQAKKIIIAGIIGLVIVLASWSLAKFALVKIGQATNVDGADQIDF